MTAARKFRAGDIVRVDGERTVWKVLAVVRDDAHLTQLFSDTRIDWRGVKVERLALAESVIS